MTHFELFAEEPPALADFYRVLFGWQVEQAPGIKYWRIQTAAIVGEGVSGGLTYRPIPGPRSWVHYVPVESLDEAVGVGRPTQVAAGFRTDAR
jgi:predicted enzyme related to lactoylglutathione lyase